MEAKNFLTPIVAGITFEVLGLSAEDAANIEVVGWQNGDRIIYQATYFGSGAIDLTKYAGFPVGSSIFDTQDGVLYLKKTAGFVNVDEDAVVVLEGKTLVTPKIDDADAGVTLTSADQTHATPVVTIPNIGDAADTFVMADTAQTLTNKTLTSPALTTPKIADGDLGVTVTSANQTHASAVATIPNFVDAADEFVMKDTAQTLTLKTLTEPVINTPAITAPDFVFGSSALDFAGGHADLTLSAAQIKTTFLVCANADAGANILAPATANKVFCVVNGSGQAITLKVTGQTGITVANAKSAFLRCTGTDYARLTADA
jgi:hypothetical protein